jgi:hypothetical protein
VAGVFPQAASTTCRQSSATISSSVRAPKGGSVGAVGLCSQYPSGGGRFSAGGINHLPAEQRDDFIQRFFCLFCASRINPRRKQQPG